MRPCVRTRTHVNEETMVHCGLSHRKQTNKKPTNTHKDTKVSCVIKMVILLHFSAIVIEVLCKRWIYIETFSNYIVATHHYSEVCHPRCVFNLYGAVSSVKSTTIHVWLNDGVY